MNSVLSVFETAVVDYLLLASITAAILVVVAWGIVKIRRVESPANRYMIWLFALAAIVLLPAIWLHGPKLNMAVLPADSRTVMTATQPGDIDFTAGPMVKHNAEAPMGEPSGNAAPEVDASSSFRPPSIMTLLAIGWGFGFLLMLIRLTVGGVRLRHFLRTAGPVSDTTGLETGGRRRIDLRLSSKVDCPVCFGLLRPVILMPMKMYYETSPEDLRMILRHELAHIERKDCWINLFQRLVEAVLFFNPFIWYASFQLTQQREELCDQHVIADGASPENYVELLGKIARQGFEKRTLQAVALFEGRLLSRVKVLLGSGGRVQIRASRKAMGLLALAAMLCLASGIVRLEARPGASSQTDISNEEEGPEIVNPDEADQVCSISGRVLGKDGEPLKNSDLVVTAFRKGELWTDGPVVYGREDWVRLEPDGSYRLCRLAGDPVIVAVTESARYGEEEEPLSPCYYPGTVSRDQAIWLDFEGGTSREQVDIKLVMEGGGLLDGVVTDGATGEPVPDTIVAVTPSDSLGVYVSAFTDENGYYRFENIGDGEWLIHVDARSSGYVRTREPVTLETGENVRLDVALKPAATVSGHFVDEAGAPVNISNMDIGKAYTEAPMTGWNSSIVFDIPSDGEAHQVRRIISKFSDGEGDYNDEDMIFPTADSFLVKAILPGKTHFTLYHLENGLEIKEILHNGESIMVVEEHQEEGNASVDAVIETRPGQVVKGITVVLGPVDASPPLSKYRGSNLDF